MSKHVCLQPGLAVALHGSGTADCSRRSARNTVATPGPAPRPHLEADVLPLPVAVQPQHQPLALPAQLLQLPLQVGLVLEGEVGRLDVRQSATGPWHGFTALHCRKAPAPVPPSHAYSQTPNHRRRIVCNRLRSTAVHHCCIPPSPSRLFTSTRPIGPPLAPAAPTAPVHCTAFCRSVVDPNSQAAHRSPLSTDAPCTNGTFFSSG